MSRPRMQKFICEEPEFKEFIATGAKSTYDINLTIEEYEVIRLIDMEKMSQEECAVQMKVSRPTIQILYSSARRKIASFIVEGSRLVIGGGEYMFCTDTDSNCMYRNKMNKCHKEERERD